ncbi:MAG: ImmA/IrrE family metallo-endopeptidase [Eubacteriales bacterium]
MNIKKITTELQMKHETRDPFKLAKLLGYTVLYVPLVDVRGFYQNINRCHTIYIDDSLNEKKAWLVCAHELGHSILHKGVNRIFMDTRTFYSSSRYEKEADRFAVDFLYDDYELSDYLDCPIEKVAEYMGVSCSLAEYRMSSVNRTNK